MNHPIPLRTMLILGLLCIIAGIGIVIWSEKSFDSDIEGRSPVGKITESYADTRVKRSGSLQWKNLTKSMACFKNDLIFTGEGSGTTIELVGGDKVHLGAQSLILISLNEIALKSGTIEIEVSQGSELKLNLGDQIISPSSDSRIKVFKSQDKTEITSLRGEKPKVSQIKKPSPKPVVETKPLLELISPKQNQVFSRLRHKEIPLLWRLNRGEKKFSLKINGNELFVNEEKYLIPVNSLPDGGNEVFINAEGAGELRVQFSIETPKPFAPLSPKKSEEILTNEKEGASVKFIVDREPEGQMVYWVSKDQKFQKIIAREISNSSSLIKLLPASTYYWKAGYEIDNKEIAVSEVNKFKVSYVELEKLLLESPPELLDFGKTSKIKLSLAPTKLVRDLKYQLKGPVSTEGSLPSSSLELHKLPDGEYELQFFGTHLGKNISSDLYSFKVKNTIPIPKPKIKRRNQKRFVYFLRWIEEFLISSSYAQEIEHDIEWFETPGSEYQIQIYSSDKKELLKDEIVQQNFYDFIGLEPGNYYWRLREIRKGSQGTFSGLEKIEISDRVEQLTKPLMREGKRDKESLSFLWDEPIKELTYQLEIFVGKAAEPSITRQVKGGKFKTRLKKIPEEEIYWRVKALSQWGGKNPSDDKWPVVDVTPKKTTPKKKPKVEKLRSIFYMYSLGKFVQTVGTRDIETEQNSPITLGFSYRKKLSPDYNLSSSIYYSRLTAVQTAGLGSQTKNLRAPYEYGLTGYLERQNLFQKILISPYVGIDYESFDAYNIDEIIQDSTSPAFRRQNLVYATLGLAYSFSLFKRAFLTKLSASQSLLSNSESPSSYNGRKYLFFLAAPILENWSINLLLKRHILSGPADMQITRYGMGIAYNF